MATPMDGALAQQGPLRVAIVGCGAMGGIYAAHLARLGHVEVWAYDPAQAVVDAINEAGLVVTGHVALRARVRAVSDPAALPPCDYGILTTKTYHSRAAAEATAHAFRGGVLCSFQNGIGNEEAVAPFVPAIISGAVFPGGHVIAPGHVECDTMGPSLIGSSPVRPAAPAVVERLAGLLDAAGLETVACPDVRGAKWTKLAFNCAANPVCALTGLRFGAAYADPDLRDLMRAIAGEVVTVAAALGIELTDDPVAQLDRAAETAVGHVPSMLNDVRGRRRTEIDALNGALVEQARTTGVPAPRNDMMARLVRGVEAGWGDAA